MKQRIFALILAIPSLFSCGRDCSRPKEHFNSTTPMSTAQQIKIADLTSVLTLLQNKQLEFDFFGVTSNGTDCIYFIPDEGQYAIEFEVMSEDQKPWLDKLKTFARQNNYRIIMTTYNNKPSYKSSAPAPVLHIETKSNLDQTALIGRKIMEEVFLNNDQTIYDVVP